MMSQICAHCAHNFSFRFYTLDETILPANETVTSLIEEIKAHVDIMGQEYKDIIDNMIKITTGNSRPKTIPQNEDDWTKIKIYIKILEDEYKSFEPIRKQLAEIIVSQKEFKKLYKEAIFFIEELKENFENQLGKLLISIFTVTKYPTFEGLKKATIKEWNELEKYIKDLELDNQNIDHNNCKLTIEAWRNLSIIQLRNATNLGQICIAHER